jgi:hypothetical protein
MDHVLRSFVDQSPIGKTAQQPGQLRRLFDELRSCRP